MDGARSPVSNANLFAELKKNVEERERGLRHAAGSVEQALASAEVKLQRTYTVEYIAHAPPPLPDVDWPPG